MKITRNTKPKWYLAITKPSRLEDPVQSLFPGGLRTKRFGKVAESTRRLERVSESAKASERHSPESNLARQQTAQLVRPFVQRLFEVLEGLELKPHCGR